MNWFLKVLKQYADFKGRARRKEFWMFGLFNFLIAFALMLIMIVLTFINPILLIIGYIIYVCYFFAIFVPSLAVAVRRLHDIGKSGWYLFFGFIPIVGGIILLVWACQDSQPGINEYGTNPKDEQESFIQDRGYYQPAHAKSNFPWLQCRVGYDNFTYKIATQRTTIGRATDNGLILNHVTVSKHHAEIVFTGNYFEVIDLGSTNRVIVNGQFFQRTTLRDGDIIGLGEAVLTFNV